VYKAESNAFFCSPLSRFRTCSLAPETGLLFFVKRMGVEESETVISLEHKSATEAFGRLLGECAIAGDVLCLDGELGAGKTTLTQAIARGLAVPAEFYVTSPSFAIVHEYLGRIPLYHMDFYRLGSGDEVLDLGVEEYFYGGGLTVIEWAMRAVDILPVDRVSLRITGHGEGPRTVVIVGRGGYLERILLKLASIPCR
jgi:tRNA threonylcarbamoyladenosine biosynthesis protein TsaE